MRSVAAEQKTVLDLAVASHLDLPICMGSDSESYQMNHGRTLLALQWLHVLHHQITVFVLLHCNLFKKKVNCNSCPIHCKWSNDTLLVFYYKTIYGESPKISNTLFHTFFYLNFAFYAVS